MIIKTCSRCGAVMPYGAAKCPACSSAPRDTSFSDARRDRRFVVFRRSAAWSRVRTAALCRDKYLCVECLRRGVITPATDVHHIVPMWRDWSKRCSLDNLVSLCPDCRRRLERTQGSLKK